MKRGFYLKLAVQNIRNNRRTYVPYLLTVIGTVMMYYSFCGMADNPGMREVRGAGYMVSIMRLGSIVIGLFSVIFLFYTNSFLIRRRKKEFALFNILGMEKSHLGRILFWETVLAAGIGLAAGFGGGILLSKLMYLLLLRLMAYPVPFGFYVSGKAMESTCLLFGVIFLVTWLNAIRQIHLASPMKLLQEQKAGEREPKTKGIMAAAGLIFLALGYTISITTVSPLEALSLFLVAVIFVILGTYLLFTAGSIAWFKFLRSRKKHYYKTRHFISVSGMLYRMKQNAVGLANICILSTMVLVMISTTMALYTGTEGTIRNRYPRELMLYANDVSEEEASAYEEAALAMVKEKYGVEPSEVNSMRSLSFVMLQDENRLSAVPEDRAAITMDNMAEVQIMTLDMMRTVSPEAVPQQLAQDEALVCTLMGNIPGDTVNLAGAEFRIAKRLSAQEMKQEAAIIIKSYIIVVADDQSVEQVKSAIAAEQGSWEGLPGEGRMTFAFGFDLGSEELCRTVAPELGRLQGELGLTDGRVENRYDGKESFYQMNGGLLFLGVFLGLLFVMAAVLIMYYKQISEGYDDRERYQIMQKVGLSKAEVRSSIRSQVLNVFFLPLVTAVIHVAFAAPIIMRLMNALNMNNVGLFFITTVVTVLVFAVLYGVVYHLTARVYYRIVSV